MHDGILSNIGLYMPTIWCRLKTFLLLKSYFDLVISHHNGT